MDADAAGEPASSGRPALRIDRGARATRTWLDGESWVDLVTGFAIDPPALLDELVAGTRWEQGEVLRYDHYVPERRLGAMLHPDAHPLLRQTTMHLQSVYRVPFSGVTALQYRTGADFQGLHSDREMRWLDDTRIAIVVLGVRRPFVIRPRGPWTRAKADPVPAGQGPDDLVLMPGEGDLLVMGGACQRSWLHGIPAAPTTDVRVSLTWRWTSRKGRPDTNPGYLDGFQFGDRRTRPGWRSGPGGGPRA